MRKFKDWSIKSKLMLLTILTLSSIVILSVTANYFFNTSKTFSVMVNGLRIHQVLLQTGIDDLYNYRLTKELKYKERAVRNLNRSNDLVQDLLKIKNLYSTKTNDEIAGYLYENFPEVYNNDYENAILMVSRFRLLHKLNNNEMAAARGNTALILSASQELTNQLLHNKTEFDVKLMQEQLYTVQNYSTKIREDINRLTYKFSNALIWIMSVIAFIIALFILFLSRYISRSITVPVKQMVDNFKLIARGNFRTPLNINTKDEIGALARSFKTIQNDFQNVIEYTTKVANGELNIRLNPKSKEDELSVSLNKMVKTLKDSKDTNDETLRFRSSKNLLNEQLQGDHDLTEVSDRILNFTSDFLSAPLGAIYIYNKEDDSLHLSSSTGLKVTEQQKIIKAGHGLIGQVAKKQKTQHLKDVPANYFTVFSGTGKLQPSNILLIPFLYNNVFYGVLELAAINTFSESDLKFMDSIRDSISVKVASTTARKELENLLEKTQQQANKLQVQQEELRVANEELAEHTNILTENEKKLQVQQEELRVANEELEERTNQLEIQKDEIEQKNTGLSLAHNKIEAKAREVEQASQYKSDFLANMSHELRTPLNSLLILSGILAKNKKGNLTPEDVESAEIINKSGKDLLQLINEILDLSKIEAGKMTVELQQIHQDSIKNEILMNFKHQAEKKKLKFSVNISSNFPQNIETDSLRLNQIIKNLLSNALKFTSNGEISVSMEKVNNQAKFWRKDLTKTNACAIKVSDTGVGIPEEKKEAIFEAFQQADGSTSRKYGGTGLGLSISKELARILGGEIHLESEVNKGSVFTLFIPITQNGKQVTKASQEPKIEIPSTKIKNNEPVVLPIFIDDDRNIPRTKSTVVLIHPNKKEASSLYHQIHETNFQALVASNIKDAIVLIETHQPSAIIIGLDLILANGEEVLEPLKLNRYASKLPMHIVNPLEGFTESNKQDLPTVQANNLTQIIDKMNTRLFTESKKILVIEDNEITRKLIKNILIPTNAKTEEAVTGAEAFKLISTNNYDCIVLDLGLPDITGNKLLENLANAKIKIPNTIIYTGKDLSRDEHRELSKYTNSIILKGLKSDERLMDEVSLFLHQVATITPENKEIKIPDIDDSIFKGKKVLVVDDEIRNIFALGRILEEKDMEVLEAENGKIAIDVLKNNTNIDLILMDIMMPEMDGYEAMTVIRKTPEIKDIPIICLTAKAMKDDYEKAIASGANDYLSKPIDENKLFSMLKIWLYN
ncbi:response regulator [Marinifilum sp. RC60d5]|uniref:response regulator n=1 Tax=Marinifilum sp. RC60d5 TaxID=3458414 RepID=UPI004036C211